MKKKSVHQLIISAIASGTLICASHSQASLIAHYTFDNAADRREDSSGNNNTGAPSASNNANTYLASTVNGQATTVLNSDELAATATNGWAIPNSVTANSTSFTISTWIKKTGSTDGYLFDQLAGRFVLRLNGNGGAFYDGNTWHNYDSGTNDGSEYFDGAWHLATIVVTPDAGTGSLATFYLDGAAYDTVTTNDEVTLSTQASNFKQRVGSNNGGTASVMNAAFDDIRIYDNALTAGEVSALMAVPEPSSAALLGLGGLALILRRRK